MYVAVHHRILDPEKAFPRGKKFIRGQDAPPGARVLQFYTTEE